MGVDKQVLLRAHNFKHKYQQVEARAAGGGGGSRVVAGCRQQVSRSRDWWHVCTQLASDMPWGVSGCPSYWQLGAVSG